MTGASASATVGAVALGQVLTTAVARRIAPAMGADPQGRTVRAAADVCVLASGLAAQRLLAQRPREPLRRAIGRTAGYELALGSGAALVTSGMGALVARGRPAYSRPRPRPAHRRGCGPGRTRAAPARPDPVRRRAPTGPQPGVRRRRGRGHPGRGRRRAGHLAGGGNRHGVSPARTCRTVGVDGPGRGRRDHRPPSRFAPWIGPTSRSSPAPSGTSRGSTRRRTTPSSAGAASARCPSPR